MCRRGCQLPRSAIKTVIKFSLLVPVIAVEIMVSLEILISDGVPHTAIMINNRESFFH